MPVRLKDSPKAQRTRLQYAEWLGNTTALIIISENDIYIRQSPSDEEDIRLTHTGVPGLIYNGVTNWLYQGMIYSYIFLGKDKRKFLKILFKFQKRYSRLKRQFGYRRTELYFYMHHSMIRM
jgi:hypothetical protein